MSMTKEGVQMNVLGAGPDGWKEGVVGGFDREGYGRCGGKGVVVRPTHGAFKCSTVYPINCLNYQNVAVGDKVKSRTNRVQIEADNKDYFVASIKVTSVDGNRVTGTYLSCQYDQTNLGEKTVAEFIGQEENWTLDEEPDQEVKVGDILFTTLKSQIKLIERARSEDTPKTDSSTV
jgi:hypothetical protein